jgi:tripartite-type tricarboxylate transporter receptor subunit TctC
LAEPFLRYSWPFQLVFAAYPERPITLIVAYAPGGGTDITARVMVPFLEKQLGGNAKIVVVNRPGPEARSVSTHSRARRPTDTPSIHHSPAILTNSIQKGEPSLCCGWISSATSSTTRRRSRCTPTRPSAIWRSSRLSRRRTRQCFHRTSGGGISTTLFQHAATVKLNYIPFKGQEIYAEQSPASK